MEDDFLCRTISSCLNDTECPAAVDCLYEIITHRADTILHGIPHWRHRETVDSGVNLLLHLILDVLPRIDRADRAGIDKMLTLTDTLCRAIPFETEHYDAVALYQRLFDVLAGFLTHEDSVKMRSFGIMQRIWARSSAPIHPVGVYFTACLHPPHSYRFALRRQSYRGSSPSHGSRSRAATTTPSTSRVR